MASGRRVRTPHHQTGGGVVVLEALRRIVPSGEVLYGLALGGRARTMALGGPEEIEIFGRVASENGLNAHFGLFAFEGPPVNGKGGRTAEKARFAKALFLDVDCGKPRAQYPTLDEGVRALYSMVGTAGLPDPMVVLTGGGLHVYWPLDHQVSKETWLLLQRALGAACDKAGFLFDRQRLLDPSTSPRIPGSINFKHDRRVVVARLGETTDPVELAAKLAAYAGPLQPEAQPTRRAVPEFSPPDVDPATLLQSCAQCRHAATPEASRQTWLGMVNLTRFCVNGRRAAHVISSNDPGRYDERETDELYDSLRGGPTTCAKFAEADPIPCAGCRWDGLIATPLQAARRAAMLGAAEPEPEPESPTPTPAPPPFQDDEFMVVPGRGVIWNQSRMENGERVVVQLRINENEFYIDGLQVEREGNQQKLFVRMRVKRPRSGFEMVFLSVEEHGSDRDLKQWLTNHRLLPVRHAYMKQMVDFMNSYLATVQDRLPITERKSRFGWSTYKAPEDEEARRCFVSGELMYTPSGPVRVTLDERAAAMARKELTVAGDLETWKQVPRMYRVLDQKEGQLFMCAAFAAPLMRFGAGVAENLVMSLWDTKGGKGKSTLLRAVNTVWGHPKNLTCSKTDTLSARYQTLGVRRNLPMCMDELTNMSDDEMSAFLYDVANGMEKRKSKSSGAALLDTGQWETVTMITSNRSVHELMRGRSAQTTAESMRVVEVECKFANHSRTRLGAYIDDCAALMDQHHGLAGPVFIDHCLRTPGLLEDVASRVREWDAAHRVTANERFWTYGLGTILEAGRVAVALGLLDYDMDALEKWVVTVLLPELRKSINQAYVSAVGHLADFLNDRVADTLVVQSADRDPKSLESIDPLTDPYVKSRPNRKLHARLEMEEELMYVSARVFDEWCAARRVSPKEVVRELAELKLCRKEKVKYNLARNVPVLGGRVTVCYVLSTAADGPLGDLVKIPDG